MCMNCRSISEWVPPGGMERVACKGRAVSQKHVEGSRRMARRCRKKPSSDLSSLGIEIRSQFTALTNIPNPAIQKA